MPLHVYCNVSWHEMGIYDLPAIIDYILANGNGEQKLFYVGHSMGTTMFFVMGSERPEYNNKIRASFQLAPVAYMSHVKSAGLIMLAFAGPQLEVSKVQRNFHIRTLQI